MATTLEQYYQTKQQLTAKIENGGLTVDQLLGYQELLYRIAVLESCMNFAKTAPVTEDMKTMCDHYKVVGNFFGCLIQVGLCHDGTLSVVDLAVYKGIGVVAHIWVGWYGLTDGFSFTQVGQFCCLISTSDVLHGMGKLHG